MVFNENFPPIIYEDEGSQVWFDRAHNVIFDRAVTTGILGLGLFLALLLYPAYHLLRYRFRDPDTRAAVIIAVSLTCAYAVQDLFIFESAVIYMSLFFVWAFLSSQFLPQNDFGKLVLPRFILTGSAILYFIALSPLLWQVNIKPLAVNAAAAEALQSSREPDGDFFAVVDKMKNVLARGTYGRQEYRLQFIEWFDNQIAGVGQIIPKVEPVLEYFDIEGQRQIKEAPENAKNHLLVMRHYNYTHASLAGKQEERLGKAMSFYPRLAELSPTRPQVPQEAGYSHLYLYRLFKDAGNLERAAAEAMTAEVFFQETVDIHPAVVESYINLVMLYLNTGEDEKILGAIDLMDERGVNFRDAAHLSRLADLARANQNAAWYGFFGEELVRLNPGDVEAWIKLAVAYATAGNRTKALEIAEQIKSFGGEYVEQAEMFIASVKAGEYEKP